MPDGLQLAILTVGTLALWVWGARQATSGRVGGRIAEAWGPMLTGLLAAAATLGVTIDEPARPLTLDPRIGTGLLISLIALLSSGALVVTLIASRVSPRFGALGWASLVVVGVAIALTQAAGSIAVIDGMVLVLLALCWAWWRADQIERRHESVLGDHVGLGWPAALIAALGLALHPSSGPSTTAWVVVTMIPVLVVVARRGPRAIMLAALGAWVGVVGGAAWGAWVNAINAARPNAASLLDAMTSATAAQPNVTGAGGALVEVVIAGAIFASAGFVSRSHDHPADHQGARLLVVPCATVLLGFAIMRWWLLWGA